MRHFLDMKWAQDATVRSLIDASEVVKHTRIILKLAKFYARYGLMRVNGSKANTIVILMAKAKIYTTASSKKLSPNKCDTGGPEIAIWLLEPKIVRHP